ncbi:DNA (cytosine-5-)-methyltransferase [Fermentimonas caenicola]|uniref:site-specific DNA-methyltransferase (adenine-specific) n=1 Tax=Fermentimonas caenicola TaxID=1562970 RepID=A0A098BZ26_9BACT|nr:DNA (cytosine-5-)-methyltransferase [Fermentimonas caenicola]
MEKLKLETPDLTQQNIDRIAELFPSAITETKDENGKLKRAINFTVLKQLLSDEVVDGEECYEFTWVGKKQSIIEGNRPIRKTLRPAKEESKNWDTTENLYIEGDNLEVLKLLQNSYMNSIKMIYIDPPYNTGNDFIYRDDFKVSREEYEDEIGVYDEDDNRLFKNTETNGRFHSDWCSMMYPRLQLARNLLSDDGVIFISIDDNEVDNLRKICDEVFGEENFVSLITVNRTSEIATNNVVQKSEYCLVYSKMYFNFFVKGKTKYTISRGTVGNAKQTMPVIEFPKGLRCNNIKDGTYQETRKIIGSSENIENIDVIVVENGKLKYPVRLKAKWRSSNDMRNFFINNCQPTVAKISGIIEEIYFEGDRFMPQIKKLTYEKISSLINYNKRGSNDLASLKLNNIFDFPKSVHLIKNLISICVEKEKNSIVLDFYSGSSTTAHAVMQLNAEDGGNRKFIMVQLPEATDEKSEAYKAGYKNICEIGKERIRRAGKKIEEELEAKSNKGDLFDDEEEVKTVDTGFRVLKVDDTNMKDVYYSAGEYSQQMLLNLESNIKEDRNDMDLLYGVLLDWGVPLSLPHTTETIEGKRVHFVNEDNLVACFEESVSEAVVREIAKRKPERVVFRDSSFSSSPEKINVTEIFKTLSPDTSVKVI